MFKAGFFFHTPVEARFFFHKELKVRLFFIVMFQVKDIHIACPHNIAAPVYYAVTAIIHMC